MHESPQHLPARDKTQPLGAIPRHRNPTQDPIDGEHHRRPPMAWPQDVPRPQNRGADSARGKERFALLSHRNIGTHHRCGMRDAHVNKMVHTGMERRSHGRSNRFEVYALKCCGSARVQVGRSDQMHECRDRRNCGASTPPIEQGAISSLFRGRQAIRTG